MPYISLASAITQSTIIGFFVAFAFVAFAFIIHQEDINSYIFNVKQMIKLLAKSGYEKETIIKVVRFYDPPNNSYSEGSI